MLARAIKGPWRTVVWIEINKLGWSRDLFACRHKHTSTKEAFVCSAAHEFIAQQP